MELCQATLQDVCNLFFFYSYIWLWSILFISGSTWRSYKSTPVRLSIRSFVRYQLFLRLDHRNFMNLTQRCKMVIPKMWQSPIFKKKRFFGNFLFEISSLVFPKFLSILLMCIRISINMSKTVLVCRNVNLPEIVIFSYFHDIFFISYIFFILYDYFFTNKDISWWCLNSRNSQKPSYIWQIFMTFFLHNEAK